MDKRLLRQFLDTHMQKAEPVRRRKAVPSKRTYRKRVRADYDQIWRVPTDFCPNCGQCIDQSRTALYYIRAKKRWVEYGHICPQKPSDHAK